MKKIVQLKALAIFAFAFLFSVSILAQDKKVYIFYDAAKENVKEGIESPEKAVGEAIISALDGYEYEMWNKLVISELTEEELAMLSAADLIIIGRGIGSTAWMNEDARALWNNLTTPVLSMNLFAVRNAHLKWFDTSDVSYGVGTEEGDEFFAKVEFPEDPIFADIELDEDNQFALWEGDVNLLINEGPGSGKVMVSREIDGGIIAPIYVRFEPGVPFYDLGEVPNTPAGYRTLFALGKDNSGGEPFDYFNFTFDGEDLFVAEVERLVNLPRPVVSIQSAKAGVSVSVYPNPASSKLVVAMNNLASVEIVDYTGKLVGSYSANSAELTINVGNLPAGVYFVKAIDSSNNSEVKTVVKK